MTVNLRQIAADLAGFYDFGGKVVLDVGAGGGQLVDYARGARKVLAVDSDATALERLAQRLRDRDLETEFELVHRDVLQLDARGDVVLLEFCLHLMPEPVRVLAHVRSLAPDLVVIGHAPGSPWSWCAAEDRGVEAAWMAVEGQGLRRQADFAAVQCFRTYAELEGKVVTCGPLSQARIGAYRGVTDIRIPMPYRIALV